MRVPAMRYVVPLSNCISLAEASSGRLRVPPVLPVHVGQPYFVYRILITCSYVETIAASDHTLQLGGTFMKAVLDWV